VVFFAAVVFLVVVVFFSAIAVMKFVFWHPGILIETTEGVNVILLLSYFPINLRVRKFNRNMLINKHLRILFGVNFFYQISKYLLGCNL
jgi:hypothetical protein